MEPATTIIISIIVVYNLKMNVAHENWPTRLGTSISTCDIRNIFCEFVRKYKILVINYAVMIVRTHYMHRLLNGLGFFYNAWKVNILVKNVCSIGFDRKAFVLCNELIFDRNLDDTILYFSLTKSNWWSEWVCLHDTQTWDSYCIAASIGISRWSPTLIVANYCSTTKTQWT